MKRFLWVFVALGTPAMAGARADAAFAAQERWERCVSERAGTFAGQPEAAATIVAAAFGACSEAERSFQTALYDFDRGPLNVGTPRPEAIAGWVKDAHLQIEQKAYGAVLVARAK